MTRIVLIALASVVAAPSRGQPPVEPQDGKLTYRLSVSPAKPLEPLSRVTLTVPYREQWQGNAAQAFLDCFSEQALVYGSEQQLKREKLLLLPIADPAVAEGAVYGSLARRLADAARFDRADWQVWHALRRDGVDTLLPGEQYMRRHAQVLQANARSEIAAGKPLDAIRTLTTQFALSRVFRHHPALIGHLIGISIGASGAEALIELVQRPECPNLFWAIAELPRPWRDLRDGVLGETTLAEEFRPLVTGPDALEPVAVARLIARMDRVAGSEKEVASLATEFKSRAADPAKVAAARQSLIDTGLDGAFVQSMGALQAIAAADYRRYEAERDALFAWQSLPFPQSIPGMRAAEAKMGTDKDRSLVGRALLPTLDKVLAAAARIEQTLAALQVVEALRYHAAETGSLPAKLADIKLPLPVDPVTGRPFGYALAGETASIATTPTRAGDPKSHREYAVTLRK